MASAPGEKSTSVGDRKAVTLADVAREAGVSIATASRVLHGSSNRRVRPALSAKVVEAAATLDYSPNAQAQAVARGHTDVIGLVVHDIADPYFSTIASGAMRAAEEHRVTVTLARRSSPAAASPTASTSSNSGASSTSSRRPAGASR
jgi:LacI family transcriptional regulator